MGLQEAWPVLSSTVYLTLLLSGLGGLAVWWAVRRSLAEMGLTGRRRRRYRRKEKADDGRTMLTPLKERLLGLDLTCLFVLWIGAAILAGGLYGINAVYQDAYIDKEQVRPLCLIRTAALPGGQAAVYLGSLPGKPELILFDEKNLTAGLARAGNYNVRYYKNTRLLISIE